MSQVPAWQDDLDQLLTVPSAAQQAQQVQREEGHVAEGGEEEAAAQAKGSRRRRKVPTGPTRQQYHSLARLLDLRPDQLARLQFLLEVHPDAAAEGGLGWAEGGREGLRESALHQGRWNG